MLRNRSEPRVAGTSMNSFFIGMMRSAPALTAWLPRSHDTRVDELELVRVLELRQEVGRADAAEARPAEVGVDGDAGKAAGDERIGDRSRNRRRRRAACRPNDCCTASDVDRDHEMRNSLTIADEITRVQPPTIALVLIVWLPNAEVPVPSTTPPKAPGIWRLRFE